MKSKKFDGTDVKKILTGIVLDKAVCARVASQWAGAGLFDATWANLVAGMAIDHFRIYGTPPGHLMRGLFEEWARTTSAGDETVESVETFMQHTSDEAYADSSEYILDLAGRHFNKVAMKRALEAIQDDLDRDDLEDAQLRFEKHRNVNLGVGSYAEQAKDIEVWLRAYEKDRERPLVRYRGDLGRFFGPAFQRGRLFAFTAPDKTGKTSWLIDFAFRALEDRNRVAFFDTGDGNEEEFTKKIGARATKRPVYECECKYPRKWLENGVDYETKVVEAHDPFLAFRQVRNVCRSENALRSSFHSSSSISAEGIDGLLEQWSSAEDWRPDVVVIDYADILAFPSGHKTELDAIDETWKRLRRMSQERHCLVITATQASSLAYSEESKLITKKHFSGRKTKNAHVNGMIGINVTPDERDGGLARINKFAWRHGRHNEKEYVTVAGCYEVGNPVILSKR